jgi:hypothetical protein
MTGCLYVLGLVAIALIIVSVNIYFARRGRKI